MLAPMGLNFYYLDATIDPGCDHHQRGSIQISEPGLAMLLALGTFIL